MEKEYYGSTSLRRIWIYLQITYKDGRKRVIEGDIGGGTIDGIMGNYLKKIFGRNYDD